MGHNLLSMLCIIFEEFLSCADFWMHKCTDLMMNLRSIFTEEQQRVLQRYYDSGMTNQSKNCFGLIIQCARETGLDFNVVRTWIGNKRRKLNSTKYSLEDPPSTQGPASNSTMGKSETPVKNTSLASPSQSQQTVLTSPCRNVMVTGVFTSTHSASGQVLSQQKDGHRCDIPKGLVHRPIGRTITEMELQQHGTSQRQSVSKNSAISICDKITPGSRSLNVHSPTSTVYSCSTKNYSPAYIQTEVNRVQSAATKSVGWPKQQFNSTIAELSQCPRKLTCDPSFSRSTSSCSSDSKVNRSTGDSAVSSLQIRDVYSLAGSEQCPKNRGDHSFRNLRQMESGCFSIAMETGDVDEYAREEELASMSSELKNHPRVSEANTPKEMECSNTSLAIQARNMSTGSSQVSARDISGSVFYHSGEFRTPGAKLTLYSNAASSEDSFNLRLPSSSNQRLTPNQSNYQVSGSVLLPCITGSSRKRTTWIGNRRRKYRQLGIELPPARGGPADFSKLPESSSPSLLAIKAETSKVPENSEDNEKSKEDVNFSEGAPSELEQREDEDEEVEEEDDAAEENGDGESVSDGSCSIPTLEKVKLEVLDDDAVEMSSCDRVTPDGEQLQKQLTLRNDKIKYLENELEKQKQKYLHLQNFTTSLVLAVKTNDTEQQQMLLTNLPPDTECNLDSPGNREQS
ncbi:highly divergent homeobox isoform X4 [Chiloscyllium plagiosum]|uniref:highly divergent homeobox isoform X4 n=1 Tax=Chiloscyllium plagiosum TaxID=36176 RepID=UPI001CB84626|nr:highly divergent homeobox isoform X4 [Chiloscyllium plagiosum]